MSEWTEHYFTPWWKPDEQDSAWLHELWWTPDEQDSEKWTEEDEAWLHEPIQPVLIKTRWLDRDLFGVVLEDLGSGPTTHFKISMAMHDAMHRMGRMP